MYIEINDECIICLEIKKLKKYPCNHNMCHKCHKKLLKAGYKRCQICNKSIHRYNCSIL